ncbi:MAG: tRNA pseudouridine(55) synthase TruB [candidate division KSB1 bacterium]|nr:tRNA pseudouridine(55) synthase TruB [candidate division KSB1 bacterium]
MRQNEYVEGEILNINKPPGWTSFDVVKKIRKLTGWKKVGHAGTLDPFATGVLLILSGQATQKAQQLMNLKKEYVGEIQLGVITDTLDVTGKILEVRPVPEYPFQRVQEVCQKFVGQIQQIPPMYSALKVQGVRLYRLARAGKEISLKPRQVNIDAIEILEINYPVLKIKVTCSKGTYIRALARDIGEALGCGGCLKTLVRTKVGHFRLEDSWELSRLIGSLRKTDTNGHLLGV